MMRIRCTKPLETGMPATRIVSTVAGSRMIAESDGGVWCDETLGEIQHEIGG
jgi:hypothetical protein